jgi:hypothetical protein
METSRAFADHILDIISLEADGKPHDTIDNAQGSEMPTAW